METMTELENKWTCPNCGTKMNKSLDSDPPLYICPECGCTLEATEQNYDIGSICPNCNQLLEDGNECPYCGYDLGSDFD
jgi:membrane protease subunit (stomatin/prohibitin family)